MVETQTKNHNVFWFWNKDIDFQKRGDTQYWLPIFLENETAVSKFPKLIDLVELRGGATPFGSNYIEHGIPFLRIQNIGENELVLDEVVFISEDTHEGLLKRSQLKAGDVLFTITGRIGSVAVVPDDMKVGNINQHIVRMRIKDRNKLLPYYLSIYLLTNYAKLQHERVAYGTTRIALDYQTLYNLKVFVPSLKDQQKVEQITKTVFQLKTEAEKEYQEATNVFLENIKTYISEWDTLTTETKKAFWLWSDQVDITNRIDPDYYSGEGIRNKLGKTKPLADLAEIKIGKTPAFDDYLPSGKRRIMKFRAITGRGIDLENEERGFVKEEFFQKNKRNKLNENDIVLGSAAHQAHYIGKYLDVVDELPKEFADGVLIVAEIMTIRVKEAINPFVLLLFLRSGLGYELIQRQIKGQTSHLYPKDVAGIGIPEAIIKISKSETGKVIESKIRSSLEKSRLSKQKFQEAKKVVEDLVTK